MVNELKAMGWVFTYIGADHDVEEAAKRIGVSNILRFDKTRQGTREMFEKERNSRNKYYNLVAENRSIVEGEYFDEK